MAKIGFTQERTFDEVNVLMKHYRTYGRNIQYRGESNDSVYIPKEWFKEGEPYPETILLTVNVPRGTKWTK